MNKTIFLILVFIISFCISATSNAAQTLVASKVEKSPVIDGDGSDPVWTKAKAIVTHDRVAGIDIILKAVYTDREIFFMVSFPDADESRTHKSWVWDRLRKIYRMGKDREDLFIFKWNMGNDRVDLSIYADNPYKADTWFWKACRTDPRGYADDKIQNLVFHKMEKATELSSKSGKPMYLLRKGDAGTPSFETKLQVEYEGDVMPRFTYREPTGSSADVKAKGIWKDGKWTIEFARLLNTGHDDDVQFDLTKSYQFGVSRFETAGRAPDPEISQPLYGSGDVAEDLTLIFGIANK